VQRLARKDLSESPLFVDLRTGLPFFSNVAGARAIKQVDTAQEKSISERLHSTPSISAESKNELNSTKQKQEAKQKQLAPFALARSNKASNPHLF